MRVQEVGPGRIDPEALALLMGRFRTFPPSEAEWTAFRLRLMETGWFDDVTVDMTGDGAGGGVLLKLETRPRLGHIHWLGLSELPEPQAVRVARLQPGSRFSPGMAQDAADRIRGALVARGYSQAQVAWRGQPAAVPGSMDLMFQIESGPKAFLHAVIFEGNTVLSDEMLLARVSQKPPLRRRAAGPFALNPDALAEDASAIRLAYLEAGCYDIVPPVPEIRIRDGEMILRWRILHEGPVYRVGEIRQTGGIPLQPELLHHLLHFRPGDVANVKQLQNIPEKIREGLLWLGHPFAEVSHEVLWRDADAKIDLEFQITPHPRPLVASLNASGNTRTQEAVILREIPLQPGDAFDVHAVRLGIARLQSRGWFSSVDLVYGHEGDPARSHLTVEVVEQQTGRIQGGISYGDVEGASLILEATEHHFRFAPPFRGGGDRIRASAQAGPRIQRANLRLEKIYFPTIAFDAGMDLGYEWNDFLSDAYAQRQIHAGADVLHVFNASHSLSFGPRWTVLNLVNVDAGLEVDTSDTEVRLSALEWIWRVDTTDRGFRPGRGLRMRQILRLGTDLLGGDTELIGWYSRVAWYFSPYRDHVFSLRGGYERLAPFGETAHIPLPLRLALGGQDNLRGFAYRSISPMDSAGFTTGGLSSGWVTAEYLLPVPGTSVLDLALYIDVGDVSAESWSFSSGSPYANAGMGFLIRAENFPVRLDIAVPIHVPEEDAENKTGKTRFSFSVGYRF